MSAIIGTAQECTAALLNKDPVVFNQKGEWYLEGSKERIVRRLKGGSRLDLTAKELIRQLDLLEQQPVRYEVSLEQELKAKQTYQNWISLAKAIDKCLYDKSIKKHPELQKTRRLLQSRLIGLHYRIGQAHGGLQRLKEPYKDFYDELVVWAGEWKSKNKIFPDPSLDNSDLRQLELASRYPKFFYFLKSNPHARHRFFAWSIRDCLNVETFIQFPSLSKWIKKSLLSGRLGYWGPGLTRIREVEQSDGSIEKQVMLPFEGQKISLLDRSKKINFKHDYVLSIEEIFKMFSRRNIEVGNIEFVGKKGFINFNSYEWGAWDPKDKKYHRIDLEKPDFYRQLDEHERLTAEEVTHRYQITPQSGQYFKVICASRKEVKSMELIGTHGWKELGAPNEDGTWTVYSHGRFAIPFPVTLLENLAFLAKTAQVRYSSHDENRLAYTFRQHAVSAEVISEEAAKKHFEDLRLRLKKAFENKGYFQFGYKNCAYWPEHSTRKINTALDPDCSTPEYFRMDLLNSTSKTPVGTIMGYVRGLPKGFQKVWIRMITFLLGGWRSRYLQKDGKRVSRNMMNGKFMKDFRIYYPAYLHTQILSGKIQGRLGAGNSWLHPEGVGSAYRSHLKPLKISAQVA